MLDPDQRRSFAALADVLIPASDPMPSATAAGVPDALLDQVLGYRPDLAEPFAEAVAWCKGKDPEAALDALSVQQPEQFQALTVLTAGAYFLSHQTKAALAYDPRRARPSTTSTPTSTCWPPSSIAASRSVELAA